MDNAQHARSVLDAATQLQMQIAVSAVFQQSVSAKRDLYANIEDTEGCWLE